MEEKQKMNGEEKKPIKLISFHWTISPQLMYGKQNIERRRKKSGGASLTTQLFEEFLFCLRSKRTQFNKNNFCAIE